LRTVVSEFWNNDKATVDDTLSKLALAASTRQR
jgi:hypothetical protein